MSVLGLAAYYHDSAACVITGGEVLAAAQEERFTRRKNDPRFPFEAARYCLSLLPRGARSVEAVAFYDNPALKRDRAVDNFLRYGMPAAASLKESVRSWTQQARLVGEVARLLDCSRASAARKLHIVQHHYSHAASAWYVSGLPEAAVLTVDGVGEYATTTIGRGQGPRLELLSELHFPHSLGLVYSAFTHYLGFKVNSGEYKLMGLAPLGEPRFADLIKSHMLTLRDDGSYAVNLDYFRYHLQTRMYDEAAWTRLFGFGPRTEAEPLEAQHRDLGASIQAVVEEAVFGLARRAQTLTGSRNLCVAGGVGLNCSAFGKLRDSGMFDRIYTQPAAGDAGGALGAALTVERQLREVPPRPFSVYLGPAIDVTAARAWFREKGCPCEELTPEALTERVAGALAEGQVVGWCQGRMEWGPRALGSRSILASPLRAGIKRELNLRIKKREGFRPFAPAVLEEALPELFVNPEPSPHMCFVAFLRPELRTPGAALEALPAEGFELLRAAVIHADHSARIQSVNEEQNPAYYRVIRRFRELTGCPMVINTSMNVRGEPIVCTFDDAYRCLIRAELDALVVGNLWLERRRQPPLAPEDLESFEPD